MARIRDFQIVVVDCEMARRRWDEISPAMRRAFRGAQFTAGFGPESPLAHTWDGIVGPQREAYRHVIAEGAKGTIAGGIFRVPIVRAAEEPTADPGWFFTSAALVAGARLVVADSLVSSAHELMREAGFLEVVTNMGTEAGALFLNRRHGYEHAPSADQQNRWRKVL